MENDTRISLPYSLGTFVVEGESKNGKPVWYRLSIWDLEYHISNGSASIRGKWKVVKQTLRYLNPPGWLPDFLRNRKRALWSVDSGEYHRDWITGSFSDYRDDFRNKALNKGIVIQSALMQIICGAAESKAEDLKLKVAEAYRNGLHSVKAA